MAMQGAWATRQDAWATRTGASRGAAPGGGVAQQQGLRPPACRGWGVPVAESVLAPPGPIPNPVVTQRSAGEYCGGDPTGGEAAAGTPHPPCRTGQRDGQDDATSAEPIAREPSAEPAPVAGWSSGSSLGS